jgi:hypothetical protein
MRPNWLAVLSIAFGFDYPLASCFPALLASVSSKSGFF